MPPFDASQPLSVGKSLLKFSFRACGSLLTSTRTISISTFGATRPHSTGRSLCRSLRKVSFRYKIVFWHPLNRQVCRLGVAPCDIKSIFFVEGVLSCMCVYLDIHSCAKYAAFWRLSAMFRRYICLPVSHRGLVGVYVCFLTSTLARRSNALTISMPLFDASRRHSASRSPWEVAFRVCGSIFTYAVTNCHVAATLGGISQVHITSLQVSYKGLSWYTSLQVSYGGLSRVYVCFVRTTLERRKATLADEYAAFRRPLATFCK